MAQVPGSEKLSSRRPVSKRTKASRPSASTNVINLRADQETRALIDRAAERLGQNRTEFMLASSRARAQEVLLDQTHFVLSDSEWTAFQKALNAPTEPTEHLVQLLARTPPWED